MTTIRLNTISLIVALIVAYVNCATVPELTQLDADGIKKVEDFKSTLVNSEKLIQSDDLNLNQLGARLVKDLGDRQSAGDEVQFTLNKIAFRVENRLDELKNQRDAVKTFRDSLTAPEKKLLKEQLKTIKVIENEINDPQIKMIERQWNDVTSDRSKAIAKDYKDKNFKTDDKVWAELKKKVVEFEKELSKLNGQFEKFKDEITNPLIASASGILSP